MGGTMGLVAAGTPTLASTGATPFPPSIRIRQRWDQAEVDGDLLWEWREYLLDCPGADELRIGTSTIKPIAPGRFLYRFENRVGYCVMQPLRAGKPFTRPRTVEVGSSKLGTIAAYRAFVDALVRDLMSLGVGAAFDLVGETRWGGLAPIGQRGHLFELHLLLALRARLTSALSLVSERPYVVLSDARTRLRISHIARSGRDLVQELTRSREAWVPAKHLRAGRAMNGFLPSHVECLRGDETPDCPENRFALDLAGRLADIVETLERAPWWSKVPPPRRVALLELKRALRGFLAHPALAGVAASATVPIQSRVLMRRDGYRQLFEAWAQLQHAVCPLLGGLEEAIELRDVDRLYEQWCFRTLAERIGALVGDAPTYEVRLDGAGALPWNARAMIGEGVLEYNATRRGYGLPFRPDLLWRRGARDVAVFDAKFRAERPAGEDYADPRRADLDKMHAYRDALGVSAAVVLYPGTEACSYPAPDEVAPVASLERVLQGWRGVAALPLSPEVMPCP